MSGFTITEIYFYGGIAIMAAAVLLAIICIIIFMITGKKLRRKLEQDYGWLPYGKTVKQAKMTKPVK